MIPQSGFPNARKKTCFLTTVTDSHNFFCVVIRTEINLVIFRGCHTEILHRTALVWADTTQMHRYVTRFCLYMNRVIRLFSGVLFAGEAQNLFLSFVEMVAFN